MSHPNPPGGPTDGGYPPQPPPPPPGPYGQQPGGYGAPPRPSNYMIPAIVTTLLFCLPAGVVSIVYASQVNKKYNQGDYQGAQHSSNRAKMWAWISFAIGVVLLIIILAT